MVGKARADHYKEAIECVQALIEGGSLKTNAPFVYRTGEGKSRAVIVDVESVRHLTKDGSQGTRSAGAVQGQP